jgi:hypothetical protein
VLKHDIRIDEIEEIIVKQSQVGPIVLQINTAFAVTIKFLGLGNHSGGDVDAVTFLEMLTQRLGESPHSTAEIENSAVRATKPERFCVSQNPIDFSLA